MSEWKAVFGDREKTIEKFACTGCGAITHAPHSEGPENGLCTCQKKTVHVGSQKFRENYSRIKWFQGGRP